MSWGIPTYKILIIASFSTFLYVFGCGPNDLKSLEIMLLVEFQWMCKKHNHWRSFALFTLFKEQCFRKFEKIHILANFGYFLPLNIWKCLTKNLKCSEILALVELQTICNNYKYHSNFSLTAHFQNLDFSIVLTTSSQIYPLKIKALKNLIIYCTAEWQFWCKCQESN